MDDDRLLRELARFAREEGEAEDARLGEDWDRLAAGDPAVAAELRALAASSPEARQAFEAFRPLDAEARARIVATVGRELGARPRDEPRPLSGAKILPFRRLSMPVVRRTAAAAALAAAALLAIVLRPAPPAADGSPLPAYGLEWSGGFQATRGEAPAPQTGGALPVLATGSPFELVLRPESAVEGPLEVALFLRGEAGVRPWSPAAGVVTVGAKGAVRIAGTVGRELDLPSGEQTLLVAVGRPGTLPGVEAVTDVLAGAPAPSDWRLLRTSFAIEDNR